MNPHCFSCGLNPQECEPEIRKPILFMSYEAIRGLLFRGSHYSGPEWMRQTHANLLNSTEIALSQTGRKVGVPTPFWKF